MHENRGHELYFNKDEYSVLLLSTHAKPTRFPCLLNDIVSCRNEAIKWCCQPTLSFLSKSKPVPQLLVPCFLVFDWHYNCQYVCVLLEPLQARKGQQQKDQLYISNLKQNCVPLFYKIGTYNLTSAMRNWYINHPSTCQHMHIYDINVLCGDHFLHTYCYQCNFKP